MICYIKKLEDHHGSWETTSLIVCSDDPPANREDYKVVEVDSIRELID